MNYHLSDFFNLQKLVQSLLFGNAESIATELSKDHSILAGHIQGVGVGEGEGGTFQQVKGKAAAYFGSLLPARSGEELAPSSASSDWVQFGAKS